MQERTRTRWRSGGSVGLKGGIALKTKLSKARRSEIARKAVQARWKKHRES
jgi:hypothetical protein